MHVYTLLHHVCVCVCVLDLCVCMLDVVLRDVVQWVTLVAGGWLGQTILEGSSNPKDFIL